MKYKVRIIETQEVLRTYEVTAKSPREAIFKATDGDSDSEETIKVLNVTRSTADSVEEMR